MEAVLFFLFYLLWHENPGKLLKRKRQRQGVELEVGMEILPSKWQASTWQHVDMPRAQSLYELSGRYGCLRPSPNMVLGEQIKYLAAGRRERSTRQRLTDFATDQMDGTKWPVKTFLEPWATELRAQTLLTLLKQLLVTEVAIDNCDFSFK